MIKIALDSSCLNAKKGNDILNKLEELYSQGKILLITSTVNEREQNVTNKVEKWKSEYLKIINMREKLLEVGKWKISNWHGFVWGEGESIIKELVEIFPHADDFEHGDFYDMWFLETAITHKCDYFLTLNENHFIKNGKQEKILALGIKVRKPNNDFLLELKIQ